jgi:hypothetical protein
MVWRVRNTSFLRSPKLSNTALNQVLDGWPSYTWPVLSGRGVGAVEVSTTASPTLLINLSTAWVTGGILLFELHRPSEGTLSRWSPWCFLTGVGYVPTLGFSSSFLC